MKDPPGDSSYSLNAQDRQDYKLRMSGTSIFKIGGKEDFNDEQMYSAAINSYENYQV